MVTVPEWCDEAFKEALEKFEDQKGVDLEPAGYEMTYEENEVGEVEYRVRGLIESKANIPIEVGGWFSHDTRDGSDNICCSLVVKVDGVTLGENKILRAWYDNGAWEKLTVEPL